MPDVATALLAPVALDPDGTGMRWTAVGAVNPDVGVAIPAVIAGNPDIAGTRGWDHLDRTWRRGTDADDNLRFGGADREEERGYSDEEIAFQVQEVPPFSPTMDAEIPATGFPASDLSRWVTKGCTI